MNFIETGLLVTSSIPMNQILSTWAKYVTETQKKYSTSDNNLDVEMLRMSVIKIFIDWCFRGVRVGHHYLTVSTILVCG